MASPNPSITFPDTAGATASAAVDLNELLTVDDVAKMLKVSRSWVYEHTRSRVMPRTERLPHIKVGKYVRFHPRTLSAFIAKKCRAF
jgi:excisionase family DNA binding protein